MEDKIIKRKNKVLLGLAIGKIMWLLKSLRITTRVLDKITVNKVLTFLGSEGSKCIVGS